MILEDEQMIEFIFENEQEKLDFTEEMENVIERAVSFGMWRYRLRGERTHN